MKTLHYDYYMQICYTQLVSLCHFTIKCRPQTTARQQAEAPMLYLFPAPASRQEGFDSFGNCKLYGRVEDAHTAFTLQASGTVRTGLAAYEETAKEADAAIFKYPHGLNVPDDALRAYYAQLAPTLPQEPLPCALALSDRLYRDFSYEKNKTDVGTTAGEAWSLGCGVCQDYAHILIALCQMAGIPARYAAGLLIGEGESHAWVEVCADGRWYGLDPTNGQRVGDDYIRINVGRDANDCQINRGVMHGGGMQTLSIRAVVEEKERGCSINGRDSGEGRPAGRRNLTYQEIPH